MVGAVYEEGREAARAGSLHHTLVLETHVRYRGEVRELDGEAIVVLWETPTDGAGPEAVGDILRVWTADGGIAKLRWYYFCPRTIAEVADRLGLSDRLRSA